MADIRSLLRNELASRKGPQSGNSSNRVTKKRKVEKENVDDLTRKRMRSTTKQNQQPQQSNAHSVPPPSAQAIDEEGMEQTDETETAGPELPREAGDEERPADTSLPAAAPDTTKPQGEASIDEDEWAAFERDVAAPTRVPHAPAAVAAEATISAAPISSEQLAEQQQKEGNSAARIRETEAEGEREDAARFMEDEFDEMEQLEERVRRLKQKRDELRKKKPEEMEPASESNEPDTKTAADSADDDDDDYDDDWDNWRFR